MNRIDFRKLPEIVLDDDYEGLLSSYIEPDARIKVMLNDDFPEHVSKISLPLVTQNDPERLDRFKIKRT